MLLGLHRLTVTGGLLEAQGVQGHPERTEGVIVAGLSSVPATEGTGLVALRDLRVPMSDT